MKMYDKQGILLKSDEEKIRLFNDIDYKIIEQTPIGIYFVSTVWLGLDHNWGEGPPLIFETMVFWRGQHSDLYMDRYSTEEQAKNGHARACSFVRAGLITHDVPELTTGVRELTTGEESNGLSSL